METQFIKLNMIPSGINPCFHVSQYDIGRSLGFMIYNGSEVVDLDSYTCTIEATRSDGVAITASVATDDNVGTFATTATMTNKADKYKAQFIIVDGDSNRIASLPFDMDVCKAAMDENSESIEEDASLYQQYTEAVQGAIAEVNADIQAEENARIAAVSNEATSRANADTTLQNNINTEATARQTADNTLQGNINSEASTRASADSNLQSQINQIVAPSGEAPSAAEVQNARIGADGVTYSTLGNAIRTNDNNEKVLRESLAYSVNSTIKLGINLINCNFLEGKTYNELCEDHPNGSYNWVVICQKAIQKNIPSGSIIMLQVYDSNSELVSISAFNYYFVRNNSYIFSVVNNNRITTTEDLQIGDELWIVNSKNTPQYNSIEFEGIILYTQKFDGIQQRYVPQITDYIPFERKYVNHNSLLKIGIGTDFPTITEGFKYALENDLGVIIMPGVYNLNNEGITINDLGPVAPKKVYGYGAILTLVFDEYTTSDPSASPINMPQLPECEIYGLTIICKYARYCIHDEEYNYNEQYHHVFKDLTLIHMTPSGLWVAPRAIGGGLGKGGFIEITNCEIHTMSYECVSYHSNALGNQTADTQIVVKDCAIRKGASISAIGSSTSFMNKMLVTNCIMGKNVADTSETNFVKVSWNNKIITIDEFDSLFPIDTIYSRANVTPYVSP